MGQISKPGTGETGRRVPCSRFSLEGVAPRDRFALWRDSINCLFEVEAEREERETGFLGEIEAYILGDMALAHTRTQAQSWARTPEIIARDGMDHFMIQIYEKGSMSFRHRGQDRVFAQNGLIVFDLAQDMRSVSSDMANLSLLLPRGLIEPHLKSAADRHLQILPNDENPMARLLFDHMKTLKAVAGDMTLAQAGEASASTAALVTACLNGSEPEPGAGERGIAFALLVRARQRIEENLADPNLTPARVARLSGVSRTRLYEMFEPFGGVQAYIRERRLRLAMRMVVDQRFALRPISSIAEACGFSNDSAFSRAFRNRFGTTARDMRANPNQARLIEPDMARFVDRRYENWIRTLSV